MADFSKIDNNNFNEYLKPKFAASHIDKNDIEKSPFFQRVDFQSYKRLYSDHSGKFSTSHLESSLLDESDQSSLPISYVNDNSEVSDYEPTGFDSVDKDLNRLKGLKSKIDGTTKEKRVELFRVLQFIIDNWSSQLPDISSIFRPEEIDRLLFDSIHHWQNSQYHDANPRFVQFLIKAGYKDKPVAVVSDSEPRSLIRTTPVHRATGHPYTEFLVTELFEIYDDPTSNYVDAESGLSHFHAACQSPECHNVVEKFLKHEGGKNSTLSNLPVEKTGDSPLHLALKNGRMEVLNLLLRNGAEPNAINKEGLTPLHVICRKSNDELLALFFKVCDEMQKLKGVNIDEKLKGVNIDEKLKGVNIDVLNKSGRSPLHEALANCHNVELPLQLLRRGANPQMPTEEGLTALHIICKRDDDYAASINLTQLLLQILEGRNEKELIDAPDKSNQTPLHYALSNRCDVAKNQIVPFLLRHGADPNKANGQGSTPLHLICQRDDDGLLDTFLKNCKELKLNLQVDARDESNRTPLQLAVANLLPKAFSALVNHGAELSDFVFPAPDYFAKRFEAHPDVTQLNFRINFAFRILSIIDRLERHKFQFDFDSVRTVMDIFIKHNLFDMPENVDKYSLQDSCEKRNTTSIMMGPGVSLFDLLHMSQKDAEKKLTYLQYAFARRMFGLLSPVPRAVCDAKLCKILMRKYLRGWSSVFPSSARESIEKDPTPQDWLNRYLKITNQSSATITDEEQIATVPKRYLGRIDFKKFTSI